MNNPGERTPQAIIDHSWYSCQGCKSNIETNVAMNTTFLDYYKIILDKVSFDSTLFMKEYGKAVKQLDDKEIYELNGWLDSQGISANSRHRTAHKPLATK